MDVKERTVNVNETRTLDFEQERRCGKVEIPVGTGDVIRMKGPIGREYGHF